MRLVSYLCIALVMPLIAGCGNRSSGTTITGTVKCKGKPWELGYVFLRFDNGNEARGDIHDGIYSVQPAEQGHARIGVGSPKPQVIRVDDRRGKPADSSAP